jgi:hypothetical protein
MSRATYPWVYDDGGRCEAGFSGAAGDCVVRAIAIASGRPYRQVYREVNEFAGAHERRAAGQGSSAREGVHRATIRRYMAAQGWVWHPTMGVGTGCHVHVSPDDLPGGTLVLALSKHITAVVDGVVRDTYDPTREGTRCVYGYWTPA